MTLDELQAHVGQVDAAEHHVLARGELMVDAWRAPMCGRDGWWWAVTRGPHAVVLALGWSSGTTRDIDIDVARALVSRAPIAGEPCTWS